MGDAARLAAWPHSLHRRPDGNVQVTVVVQGRASGLQQVMLRAQLESQKPIDVFKGKKHAEPLRAYRALVVMQQRQGLYSMLCVASPSASLV